MPSALPIPVDSRAYDLDGGAMARDMATQNVTVDPLAMSATCVFSTGAMDRVGDVVEVSGILTGNHQRNPVVGWNHFKNLTLPIGKTVDPDGIYTVSLGEDVATQTTFFSQSLFEAEQIFRLIDEGIINANSIAFDNKRVQPIFAGGVRKGLHILECDLLEISWVGLPVNPEAVRKAIDSLVCGKPLCETVRRSLEPYAARCAAWANGVTLKCYDVRAAILKSAEFEESKHPRATDGRFGDKPGQHEGADDDGADEVDDEEVDDEPEEEEGEEPDEEEVARSRAAEAATKLPDKRPDTILSANVELRNDGDWVISLATGEPVHLDDYESDLSGSLAKILPQIKNRNDLNALNEELDTIGDEERVFYNGSKPEVISGDGIDNETLAAINTVAWRSGGDLASVANLNDDIAGDTDYRVLPDGKYKVELIHSDQIAEHYDESDANAASLSNEIDAYPESGRAEMAERWNQFLEDHFSDTRLVPDLDQGRYTAINTAMLDEPDRVAEYVAEQYDLSDGGEARVEWFNDLMAEYGSGDRLRLVMEDGGDLAVEAFDPDSDAIASELTEANELLPKIQSLADARKHPEANALAEQFNQSAGWHTIELAPNFRDWKIRSRVGKGLVFWSTKSCAAV